MLLNKKVTTRVAFVIVLLWLALSLGLVYWQWDSTVEQFKKSRFPVQQILE